MCFFLSRAKEPQLVLNQAYTITHFLNIYVVCRVMYIFCSSYVCCNISMTQMEPLYKGFIFWEGGKFFIFTHLFVVLFHFPFILSWVYALYFFKYFREISSIIETHLISNANNRLVCMFKQIFCFVNTYTLQIIDE